MKRLIFTILIAVATVSMLRAQEPTSLEAIPSSRLQDSLYATPVPTTVPVIEELPAPTFYADLSDSSASMPTSVSPVRRKQRFLPMKRRIDREINKIKFAYAGEIALGLTVSYGTLSSDDTDYLLILDNLNLNGSIFTINPSVGYFFKDNMSAGVRFGYTNINGTLDTGNFNLGEQNDVNLRSGFAWGCRVERVHVGEEHQSVGDYDVGDQCGESVVVSETDFVGREGIVFVDDRHHAEVKQTVQRAFHIAVLGGTNRIFGSDQNLADANTESTERSLVAGHQ